MPMTLRFRVGAIVLKRIPHVRKQSSSWAMTFCVVSKLISDDRRCKADTDTKQLQDSPPRAKGPTMGSDAVSYDCNHFCLHEPSCKDKHHWARRGINRCRVGCPTNSESTRNCVGNWIARTASRTLTPSPPRHKGSPRLSHPRSYVCGAPQILQTPVLPCLAPSSSSLTYC